MNELATAPELILTNARIHTLDDAQPLVEALAIGGGRILAIGSTDAIRRLAQADTRRVDLEGRMVIPGLVDAHCHPTKGALAELYSCRFGFESTPADIEAALHAFITRQPEAPCVIGGRWGSDFFERHALSSPRDWLDARSAGRAVYLRDDSGHNGWANSQALALVGITRDTPDPAGGRILRDPVTGEPTGRLLEAADAQARARLPDWTPEQYEAGVRRMQAIANAYGITGINDADASEPLLRAYQAVERSGQLTVHVVASLTTPFGHRTTPLDYAKLEALRDRYGSAQVDTSFVKIYQDGVPTSARSAAMLAPYLPHPDFAAGHRGELHVAAEVLAADLAALEQRGFTVKLHTAGDRAVQGALDAIEQAHQRSGRRDLRHELAHAGFIAESDLPRFRALNVAADLSPYLWHPSPIIDSIVAAVGERGRKYWPVRTLLDEGVAVLAGSDWPAAVASMDPWPGLAALVTRRDPSGASPGALWPEQAISLGEALRIFTLDGARALRREAETGSLTPGKRADLVVLSQDLYEIEPDRIAETSVLLTLFGGRVVHETDEPLAAAFGARVSKGTDDRHV